MDGPGRVDGWYTATSLADIIVYSVRQGSGKIWACREQFWRKRCSACMYSATIKPLLTMTVTMAVVVWKRRVRWKTAANTNILIKHMRKYIWITGPYRRKYKRAGAGVGSDPTIPFKINRSQTRWGKGGGTVKTSHPPNHHNDVNIRTLCAVRRR